MLIVFTMFLAVLLPEKSTLIMATIETVSEGLQISREDVSLSFDCMQNIFGRPVKILVALSLLHGSGVNLFPGTQSACPTTEVEPTNLP